MGRRAHRLEPDPQTAPTVAWMFAQRLAGHSMARITRALDDAAIPCPSAADPGRTRTAAATRGRCTPSARSCATPATPAVRCGTASEPTATWSTRRTPGWVTGTCSGGTCQRGGSSPPARPTPAIVSEADFISVQDLETRSGPGSPPGRCYLLVGLLRCGVCERHMESCWSNGKPAYRCRHGHSSAARPDPTRPRNAYIREDQILSRLPALAFLLGVPDDLSRAAGQAEQPAGANAAAVIGYLRASRGTLTFDPGDCVLRAETQGAVVAIPGRSHEHQERR